MNDLEQLSTKLREISPQAWQELFEFIPKIEDSSSFGSQQGEQKIAEGFYMGTYIIPNEVVIDLVNQLDSMGLIPVFDWKNWTEGREMVVNNNTDFNKLDLITLIKLFTVMSRQDRFSDGFLVNCFEKGIVLRILKAIQSKVLDNK